MTNRKPKDLLSGQELIGFMRRPNDGAQVARRASSAKVTEIEPTRPPDPAKGGAPKVLAGKSGSS